MKKRLHAFFGRIKAAKQARRAAAFLKLKSGYDFIKLGVFWKNRLPILDTLDIQRVSLVDSPDAFPRARQRRCDVDALFFVPISKLRGGTAAINVGCRRCKTAFGGDSEGLRIALEALREMRNEPNKFAQSPYYALAHSTCQYARSFWVFPEQLDEPFSFNPRRFFEGEDADILKLFTKNCNSLKPTLCIRNVAKGRCKR